MVLSSTKRSISVVSGLALVIATGLFIPAPAIAQLGLTASASAEYMDNPRRLPGKDEQDTRYNTTLAATLQRQTRRFDTAINYSVNRQDNVNDVLNDISRVDGNGLLAWKAIPDFLTWNLSNTRSNQVILIAEPDTPDNRQIVDITSTGPSFSVPLGNSTFANFSADYSLVSFEVSELQEHKRNSYNFALSRFVSRGMIASFRTSFTGTSFDQPFVPDYSFFNYSLNLQLDREVYQFNAEIGEYHTERAGQDTSYPTYSLSGIFQVNSRLEISGDFSRRVEDLISDINNQSVVNQFFQDSGPELGQTFGNSNAPNFFESETMSIGATYTMESAANFGLRYSRNQRSGVGALGEQNDERLAASLSLLLPQIPRLSLNASAAMSVIDFSSEGTTQNRLDLRVGGSYRLGERLNLTFAYIDNDQTSDLDYRNFVANMFTVGLSFAYLVP